VRLHSLLDELELLELLLELLVLTVVWSWAMVEFTRAMFVSTVPLLVEEGTVTMTMSVLLAPAARLERVHLTVEPWSVPPSDAVTKVTLLGRTSVTWTFEALRDEVFVTVIW
jgi:hypothetical protein